MMDGETRWGCDKYVGIYLLNGYAFLFAEGVNKGKNANNTLMYTDFYRYDWPSLFIRSPVVHFIVLHLNVSQ